MTIVESLERSGLAGRGGAAFRTAIKVRAAHRGHGPTSSSTPVTVSWGQPRTAGSSRAASTGSSTAPGWSRRHRRQRARYAAHRGSVTEQRLRDAGLEVLDAPARYVSSEETSLISLAHGGLARPMTKRAPFVYGGRDSAGRRIRPTVVLNAETVWRIGQIADHGAEWFRSTGTVDEPGPRLVTITGHVPAPGVTEASAGIGAGGCPGRGRRPCATGELGTHRRAGRCLPHR